MPVIQGLGDGGPFLQHRAQSNVTEFTPGTLGAAVFLTGRNESAGEELVTILRSWGARAAFAAGDVANEDHVRGWLEAAVREFGQVDVAVNNAGIEGSLGPVVEQTVENFTRTFDINVKGTLLAMKHEIPVIAKQGGAIVNLSSIVGDVGMAGASVYVASKHPVNGLTRSAALETARTGVRVNAVAPGWRCDTDARALYLGKQGSPGGVRQHTSDWPARAA